MPKANQSKIGGIVAFFRSAPLEVMDLAFDLVRDEVNGRRAKSREAKARAAAPAAATANAAAAPAKKAKRAKKVAGPKKSHHKKRPAAPVNEPLPLDALSEDAGEADDAPPQTLSAPAGSVAP